MSGMASRTKKVNTYGRKKTNVIAIHDDFTSTYSPAKVEHMVRPATTSSSTVVDSPVVNKRPALTTKHSNDTANINLNITVEREEESLIKVSLLPLHKAKSPTATEFIRPSKPRKVIQSNKAINPPRSKSPSVPDERVGSKTPVVPVPTARITSKIQEQRQILESVEIVTRISGRQLKAFQSDISEQFSQISLDEPEQAASNQSENNAESHIDIVVQHTITDLLSTCSSTTIHNFTSFLTGTELRAFLPSSKSGVSIRKAGEASYSEVFACSVGDEKEIMIKVIPLLDNNLRVEGDFPEVSLLSDVLREIDTTKRMSQVPGGGFIEYLGSFVVEGSYPKTLIDKWWEFKKTLGSASVCPDAFNDTQRYAVILLSDGGVDLETFKFDPSTGWIQAVGMFWQVADSLARAEKWTQFEHRDLHEGQILLSQQIPNVAKLNYLEPESCGIRATIIDFGLSRLDTPGTSRSTWSEFPSEVFEGKGNQWDVYRSIRDVLKEDWEVFHPISNVMWLHYLTRYLLNRTKSLKKPRSPSSTRPSRHTASSTISTSTNRSSKTSSSPSSNTDENTLISYQALCRIEEVLAFSIDFTAGRRKNVQLDGVEKLCSAGDVIGWGRECGFI